MPAVPPYSSTTIARWWPSRRISDSAGSTVFVAGSIFTGRVTSETFSPVRAATVPVVRRNRSRTWTKPTTSSCESRQTG